MSDESKITQCRDEKECYKCGGTGKVTIWLGGYGAGVHCDACGGSGVLDYSLNTETERRDCNE